MNFLDNGLIALSHLKSMHSQHIGNIFEQSISRRLEGTSHFSRLFDMQFIQLFLTLGAQKINVLSFSILTLTNLYSISVPGKDSINSWVHQSPCPWLHCSPNKMATTLNALCFKRLYFRFYEDPLSLKHDLSWSTFDGKARCMPDVCQRPGMKLVNKETCGLERIRCSVVHK